MKASLLAALQGIHSQRIAGPAAGAFLLRILGAGFQFLFTVLLARFYGAAGVGVFVIALSLLVVGSTIARWGLDQASLKLVAANLASGHLQSVRAIVAYAGKFTLLSGALGTLLLLLLARTLSGVFFQDGQATWTIAVMALALLPLSLMTVLAEALRGLRRVTLYTLLHGALIPSLSILSLLLFQLLVDDVIAGAFAYLSATLVTLLIATRLWFRAAPETSQDESATAFDHRDMLTTSHSLAWVTIISVLMSFTETFVLGLFHDEASVGIYAASLRIALIINFITIAFNSILAPDFASLYRQGKLDEIQALARHAVVVMLSFAVPPVALVCLLPSQVLSIFGQEFAQGSSALVLLSLGQLIIVLFGPVGILLQMTGKERAFRNNVIASALTTLVTAVILIPPYAVMGAAVSAVIGILMLNTLSLISVRKRLGINPLPLLPSLPVNTGDS